MTKAWRSVGALGFIFAVTMGGCVITSGDPDDTGGTGGTTGGTGGTTGGTGGTTGGAAGATTGGTAGATGGAAGATGGSAGYVCENTSPPPGTKGSCVPDNPADTCQACVEAKCCTQFEECLETNPNNPCSFGGPAGEGEIYCMIDCVQKGLGTPAQCGGTCTTPSCGTLDPATSELWACMDKDCLVECGLN
jgi:hypothetical protein